MLNKLPISTELTRQLHTILNSLNKIDIFSKSFSSQNAAYTFVFKMSDPCHNDYTIFDLASLFKVC